MCGTAPTVTELIDYEGFCGVPAAESGEETLQETTAADVQARRERGDAFLLLDVREQGEFETARIEGSMLIPLGELEARLEELSSWRQSLIVVHCHHGGRSAAACKVLLSQGFEQIENLAGGIEAWSVTIDSSVPRY